MDIRKHYFMTFAALFLLGMVIAKPGDTFYPVKEKRDCKLVKAKMQCEFKGNEYRLKYPVIHYEFQ